MKKPFDFPKGTSLGAGSVLYARVVWWVRAGLAYDFRSPSLPIGGTISVAERWGVSMGYSVHQRGSWKAKAIRYIQPVALC